MSDESSPAEPGCTACAQALIDPEHGLYMLQCRGCQARMLSFGQPAWQALHSPTPDPEPLRSALLTAFGEGGYLAGRRRLWQWVQLSAAHAASKST